MQTNSLAASDVPMVHAGYMGWRAPLLGRMFFHRVLDCYTLVRDYYQRERGIELLDFEREDDWWHKGQDLYMQGFERAGFAPLARGEALQPGDVILMQVRSPVANHAGVYLGHTGLQEQPGLHPVPHAMLHHLYGRLSERVVSVATGPSAHVCN